MGAETERVHWFTEGCWTGMCFPKTLSDAKKHDLKTGTRARRVTSSQRFCSGTGLSGRQEQADVLWPPHPYLKDHQKNRISTGPLLSDAAVCISGVPGSAAAQITAGVYRPEL